MTRRQSRWTEWLTAAGAMVAVLVCLPLIAVAVFTVRFAALAVAAGALVVGTLAFAFSARFREWLDAWSLPLVEHKGLRLEPGVAMDRTHAWARFRAAGVQVGADDLIQATLGPADAVDLPAVGVHVQRGDPLFTLRRGERRVEVLAPVSGTVAEANEAVRACPALVNREPFGEGWIVRLDPERSPGEKRLLMRGSAARNWFRGEVDRLIGTLLADTSPVPVLPDGGSLVNGLYRQIDDRAWAELQDGFFGRGHQVGAPEATQP